MADPLTSPGAAFASQAKMEARVEAVLLSHLTTFLADVEEHTLREGLYASPSFFSAAWERHMSAEALARRLPQAVAAYVSESLVLSTVPDEAHESAMAVMTRATEQSWSTTDIEAALHAALSPDSGQTFLTAGAPVVERDENGKPIYRRTAKLDEGGMSWWARMQQDARTSATGLQGIIAAEELRQAGIPEKRWVTRRDERVRETHAEANGQTVPVGEPFIVGGYPMMHPGDRSAPAALVVNCRCVMVGVGE